MKRRQLLALAAAGLITLCGNSCGLKHALHNKPKTPPNIILIMADDLGWAELGAYGQDKIQTPNIDRLASQGMKFTQFYAGSAVCAPSRCNLLTGYHGGHAYVRDNHAIARELEPEFHGQLPLPADEPNIAETVKAQGYVTGCFGKWGLGETGSTGDPMTQGFDRFYGYNCQRHAHNLYPRYLVSDQEEEILPGNTRGVTGETYAPERISEEARAFLKENKDKPFFLYYPTVLPHLPLQVPQEYLDLYKGKWKETPYNGNRYLPHPTPKAAYAAMITYMDAQVGKLLDDLEKYGLAENTVVIFTSDNGTTFLRGQVDYEFFESVGPLRGLKGSLHEGGIRVPMIVRWPGVVEPGTTSDLVAAHYDLPATIADIIGTEFALQTDGISIVPTLAGMPGQQTAHEYLFWDFEGYGGQRAVRMGDWKGIRKDLKDQDKTSPLELYDLSTDIGEENNVAAENPDVARKIEEIMRAGRSERPIAMEVSKHRET